MDHGFARKREPWEATDGAIYLLRELAAVRPEEAPAFLPALATVVSNAVWCPRLASIDISQPPSTPPHTGDEAPLPALYQPARDDLEAAASHLQGTKAPAHHAAAGSGTPNNCDIRVCTLAGYWQEALQAPAAGLHRPHVCLCRWPTPAVCVCCSRGYCYHECLCGSLHLQGQVTKSQRRMPSVCQLLGCLPVCLADKL